MFNMNSPLTSLSIGVMLLAMTGCKTTTEMISPEPAETMASLGMKNEIGAVFLANEMVEVAVSPTTGRILHFGFIGGENLLWTNPDPVETKPGEWQNWGGDKVWIWPETEWSDRSGDKKWKPPSDPPTEPYTVERTTSGIIMKSPVIDKFGVRLVREISLGHKQPTMKVVNRFEVVDRKVVDNGGPLALWNVTQIKAPTEIIATPVPVMTAAGLPVPFQPKVFMDSETDPWLAPQQALDAPGDLIFIRPTTASVKIGFEANQLRVQLGDVFLSQKATFSPTDRGTLEPNERAQLYTQPGNDTSGDKAAYAELEFTSPKWLGEDLIKGSLTIEWTLWKPAE